jgi:hypothetical protein
LIQYRGPHGGPRSLRFKVDDLAQTKKGS